MAYIDLDKKKDILTSKTWSPLEDMPLWLSNIGKGISDWWQEFRPEPSILAQRKAASEAEQRRQQEILAENIRNIPQTLREIPQTVSQYPGDIAKWYRELQQSEQNIPEWQKPLAGMPSPLTVAQGIMDVIGKGVQGWGTLTSPTPMGGSQLRRTATTPYEEWTGGPIEGLLGKLGVTQKNVIETLTPDILLAGAGFIPKIAKLAEVARLIKAGKTTEEIAKAMKIIKPKPGEVEALISKAKATIPDIGDLVNVAKTETNPAIENGTVTNMRFDSKGNALYRVEGLHNVTPMEVPLSKVKLVEKRGVEAAPASRPIEPPRVTVTQDTIHRLKALGYTDEQIGRMPAQDAYDKAHRITGARETTVLPITEPPLTGTPPPTRPPTIGTPPPIPPRPPQPPIPPSNLPPVAPVPPIPTPAPAGSGLDMLRNMYQAGARPTKTAKNTMLRFMEWVNDQTYGIRQMQGRVAKVSTVQPGGVNDFITAATTAPGAANTGGARFAMALQAIKRIAPDVALNDIRAILDSYHFKEVLAAKGTERVMAGGITDARMLDDILPRLQAELGADKFNRAHQAAEYIRDIYTSERGRLAQEGLISPELAAELAEKYPWYNPLQYVDDAEKLASTGKSTKPFSVISSGLKRLGEKGTAEATRSTLDILAETLVKNEVRIKKNQVAKSIIKLALDDPTLIDKVTKKSLIRPVAVVDEKLIFRPTGEDIPGTLSFFENGKRQVYEVPDFIYREAVTMQKLMSNPMSSLIGAMNGVSRAAFTTASPAFVVSNILNDSLTAFVKAGVLPHETAGRLIKSIFGLSNDKIYQAFNLAGGHQARFYGEDVLKAIEKSGGRILKTDQSFLSKLWKEIPRAGEAGEQAPRIVAFRKELDKTLPSWKRMTAEEIAATPQGKHAAATAVEATINFGRGGYLIKSANPFVIFLNASMEGSKLPFRALRDNPAARWRLAGVGAGIAGLSAYNLTYPEYFDIPNYVRWGSVVVMLPSKEKDANGNPKPNYLTIIPRTREWGAFLGSETYALEKMFSDNPTEFGTFSATMAPILSPISNFPAPQVIEEIGGQLANYDFYRSQPIVPPEMEALPPEQQVQSWVSPTLEKIANITGQSPLRVQHLANGLFGGAGQAVTSVTDYITGMIAPKEYDPKIVALAEKYETTDNKIEKNKLLINLTTKEKDDMFAYINRPQKGVPIVSPVAGRVVGTRGGQLYKTGQELAQKETGISPSQTRTVTNQMRKVSDIYLERQKVIDKSFQDKKISGATWRAERTALGQRYQGALDLAGIEFPQAVQVQKDPSLAEKYYKTVNTLAGTATDTRQRVDILASGWYAIDLQEVEPGSNDWATYNKMKDAYLASLSIEDKALLDDYLQSKMTDTEQLYNNAQKVLKQYWEITDKMWGQYPPEVKRMADMVELLESSGERDDKRQAIQILRKYPVILLTRKRIAVMKKRVKAQNPTIKKALSLFYSY